MSLKRKIELSLIIAIISTIIFSIISFAKTSEEIRNDVLRLHVIANSDSEADQELKIKVRDAVLECGSEIFDGSINVENAVEKITPQIKILENAARDTIKNNGFDYNVKITIDYEYFETRIYENVTLPAGEYLSLIVKIGEGEGKNWWCVMFPPMCISAADERETLKTVFNLKEIKLVSNKPEYEPRFKIVEIYENFKHKYF